MTYPGDRPSRSYFLLDDYVYLIHFEDKNDITSAYIIRQDSEYIYIDDILKKLNLPTLLERYAILAYGANRNPATLALKFLNYNYKTPGKGIAIPVMQGFLKNADVTACNIYGQGYLNADVVMNSEFVTNTKVESWLTLLDIDQLRALNHSEGVRNDIYILGQFPGYSLSDIDLTITALGYVAKNHIFVSPKLKKPISFSTISAKNRRLPEMKPLAMLDHLLDVFKIRKIVSQITGLKNNNTLSLELSKYLNGQWWYFFNTKEKPIKGYLKVIELFEHHISKNSLTISTADYLNSNKLALKKKLFYFPGSNR